MTQLRQRSWINKIKYFAVTRWIFVSVHPTIQILLLVSLLSSANHLKRRSWSASCASKITKYQFTGRFVRDELVTCTSSKWLASRVVAPLISTIVQQTSFESYCCSRRITWTPLARGWKGELVRRGSPARAAPIAAPTVFSPFQKYYRVTPRTLQLHFNNGTKRGSVCSLPCYIACPSGSVTGPTATLRQTMCSHHRYRAETCGEGWRSVRPIMWEMKKCQSHWAEEYPTWNKKTER